MSTITTETDLDEESVNLVPLPPSPTLDPSIDSTTSTPVPQSIPPHEPKPEKTSERPSTIPTPKSRSSTDTTSPPPRRASTSYAGGESIRMTRRGSSNPQLQDSCMFCTPETAPPGANLDWIQCNGCKRWSHTLCTGLPTETDITTIDKFHCKRCEKTRGPTTFRPPPRKSERSHVNIDYTSLNLGETTGISPDQHAYNALFEGDTPRKFAPDRFQRMKGDELTKEWAERTGCKEPVVVPRGHSAGMGMVMPVDLTVKKVAELVGQDEKVEVIDVPTQKEAPNWKLKEWADYYDTPAEERDRVRNVISLEVSSSALGAQVVRPQFVRDLDLIEKVWPLHLRPKSTSGANPSHAPVVLPNANNTPSSIFFPKVTLYCLMSVARSYTDFHVDFGGSSVFYHILKGNKTFLFIEPNSTNLRRYESWCSDSDQSRRFLGEEVKECIRVDLSAGDTMIIPSGWIHAVYTPTDSLVLGGNFLTPLHIPSQLNIAGIENRTRVPKKFRFPFFDMAMWYTAIYYLETYVPKRKRGPPPKHGRRNTEGMSEYEIAGLKALAEWLWKKSKLRSQQMAKGTEHRAKVEVPPGVDVIETAMRFAKWVYDGDEDGEAPPWYRSEVFSSKVETPRKRKREEDGTTTMTRKTRRSLKKEEVPAVEANIPKRMVELSRVDRVVVTYKSVNVGASNQPIKQDTVFIEEVKPTVCLKPIMPPMDIYRPYSSVPIPSMTAPDSTFLNLIQSNCRPYMHPTPVPLLEEIKVEDEPLGGLDALTRAVELATQPRQYAASTGSTLTIFSASPEHPRLRLPTPSSESPSPMLPDPLMSEPFITDSGSKKRRRSTPKSTPRKGPKEDATESMRLQSLLTPEELQDFRRRRRRGASYMFGAASLRRELTRLGKKF